MRSEDIIRAWKDASFREGLSADQLMHLPASPIGPVGPVELQEDQLAQVGGGGVTIVMCVTLIIVSAALRCF